MLVSGKLFTVLIAAVVTSVTGSPVELEKRDATLTVKFCVKAIPGPGNNCYWDDSVWNKCRSLEFTTFDKNIVSFNPYGFICTLYS